VRGVFAQSSNTANRADDCLSHQRPASRYGSRVDRHGGITVFGTDRKILYPGCGCGSNCKSWNVDIDEQEVPRTNTLVIESHQSVPDEKMRFDLNKIEVRLLSTTSTATTTTLTTTTNTQLQALVDAMQALEKLGHDAKIEDLTSAFTTFVAEYEAEKVASEAREASMLARLAALEATVGDAANSVGAQEFAAFKQSTLNTLADLVSRFQAASDAAATAGDATDDGDDDATNSNPAACSDADGGVCAPSIEADGQNLRINAPGGAVHFSSSECTLAADLCELHRKVENMISALYSMGSD
jgi:hypothetical protein